MKKNNFATSYPVGEVSSIERMTSSMEAWNSHSTRSSIGADADSWLRDNGFNKAGQPLGTKSSSIRAISTPMGGKRKYA